MKALYVVLKRRSVWKKLLRVPGVWWGNLQFALGNPGWRAALRFAWRSTWNFLKM